MQSHPQRRMAIRLYGVLVFFLGCFLFIAARLFYLQVHTWSFFAYLGQRNFLRKEKIASPRGSILDCEGRLLATNRPTISISWQGTGSKVLTEEQVELVKMLQTICTDEILEPIKHAERGNKKIILKTDVPLHELSLIIEKIPHHPNVIITTDFQRLYPHGSLGCHLLGYIGAANNEISGKMGLEKLLHATLKGVPGEKIHIINSVGKELEEHLIHQASTGKDVTTTIDLDYQMLSEYIFPQGYSGALLVINPKDGSLLAMVSRPQFDPNLFLSSFDKQSWDELQINKPFVNRCFEACYPPASLFKLITVAAALEQNIITEDETWYCTGQMLFCGRPYHCHNHFGHGTLTIENALAQSCNIPFYEIAKKIKINTLAHYAHLFGLGESTGILLPEKKGLIPTAQWKRETLKEPWWPGETLSAVIGQTYLLTTPAQSLRMFSGIIEGNLVKLRVFIDEPVEIAPLGISTATQKFLRESTRQVIIKGTGQALKKLQNIEIYAKTGTAQTSDLSKRGLGTSYLEHAWFVAHARYKNHDPIAFIIVIEHAGSSAFAKKVAYDFLSGYSYLMDNGTLPDSMKYGAS